MFSSAVRDVPDRLAARAVLATSFSRRAKLQSRRGKLCPERHDLLTIAFLWRVLTRLRALATPHMIRAKGKLGRNLEKALQALLQWLSAPLPCHGQRVLPKTLAGQHLIFLGSEQATRDLIAQRRLQNL
jgi:hypothetical protein